MHTSIIIPARYASTRLPGKPLIMIAGQTMLRRVIQISREAAKGIKNVSIVVATDDERILTHCSDMSVTAIMTSPQASSGTDRVAEAVEQMITKPDFILNMQGDAPLTPPYFLQALIKAFSISPCDAITPVTQLTWEQLEKLRQNKKITPFSGTTAVFDKQTGNAIWFSKNIIPSIRKEKELRQITDKSPVFRHIGLYGYSLNMLKQFNHLPESPYEKIEELEQLRILENGYTLRCVPVEYHSWANMSGIDSLEDVSRAEELLLKHGELVAF